MASVFTPDTSNDSTLYKGPFKRKLFIVDTPEKGGKQFDITDYVTKVSVSYTMNEASEVSFDIVDQDLAMSAYNYFILGRTVIYETQTIGSINTGPNSPKGEIKLVRQLFEIANVNVTQGAGRNVTYSVKCYTKAIQQMKRDKQPANIKGNGSAFVKAAALKYGLQFFCEETTKKKTVNKAGGSKQADSVWTVMDNLAKDAKFVLFEVDGVLVFASEKFLFKKWGTDVKYSSKTVTDPRTKKKKKQKKANRFIPLQFPSPTPSNPNIKYVGTPGYFELMEYPSITKSANDPYAGDGSCSVDRQNGTQIRPGMTAYVGTIPNMSGYYLVESVSFNEMVPDPVAVSFRTLTRDEEKDTIQLLPLGKTFYKQTTIGEAPFVTTIQAAKTRNGLVVTKAKPDTRIIAPNEPTSASPYIYPIMPTANITRTYGGYRIGKNGKSISSTFDADSLIIRGNLDLWNRPVLPYSDKPGSPIIGYHTLYSMTIVEQAGSEYRAIILPTIYTENGMAVKKTEAEIEAKYRAAGGYQGTAKHLGVLRGATKADAILNADDYAWLLSRQAEMLTMKRFPGLSLETLTNVPGGSDSVWT
jgi:hypothetical protein